MIYREDKSSVIGLAPGVILLAIAAILGGLLVTTEHPPSARVFVPVATASP